MTLVLCWDIDGTLLTTGRAGIFAWEDAAAEHVGHPVDLATFETAGLTDVEIAARIAERLDLPAGAADTLLRRYEALLPDRLHRRKGAVLPGVRPVLERLRDRVDIVSMLLTGNTEAGARAKLTHYGLMEFFEHGAFADGCRERSAIARRALDVARERLGRAAEPSGVYVIGDTPHDIACARAIGARAVAVASGNHTIEELARHDPWWLLPRLPAPDAFLARLEAAPAR